jgi:hypothetical protein
MSEPINPKPLEKITCKQFAAYERIRRERQHDMVSDARNAAFGAGLDLDTYFAILRNYEALAARFPDVRKL